MAWIYLAESEDSQSPWHRGSSLSLTVKATDTLNPFFFAEWLTDRFLLRRFGTTSARSRVEICHRSIFFTEVSPARMSVSQEIELAWKVSEPAFSVKQFDLFENVDLSSYSSKMCRESEDMCLASGGSLRRLATLAATDSLVRQNAALPISEIDGGYLPTPSATEGERGPMMGVPGAKRQSERTLSAFARSGKWPTPRAQSATGSGPSRIGNKQDLQSRIGGPLNPAWVEWLMGYRSGHTELRGSVMQWFRSKRGWRSKCCLD